MSFEELRSLTIALAIFAITCFVAMLILTAHATRWRNRAESNEGKSYSDTYVAELKHQNSLLSVGLLNRVKELRALNRTVLRKIHKIASLKRTISMQRNIMKEVLTAIRDLDREGAIYLLENELTPTHYYTRPAPVGEVKEIEAKPYVSDRVADSVKASIASGDKEHEVVALFVNDQNQVVDAAVVPAPKEPGEEAYAQFCKEQPRNTYNPWHALHPSYKKTWADLEARQAAAAETPPAVVFEPGQRSYENYITRMNLRGWSTWAQQHEDIKRAWRLAEEDGFASPYARARRDAERANEGAPMPRVLRDVPASPVPSEAPSAGT